MLGSRNIIKIKMEEQIDGHIFTIEEKKAQTHKHVKIDNKQVDR